MKQLAISIDTGSVEPLVVTTIAKFISQLLAEISQDDRSTEDLRDGRRLSTKRLQVLAIKDGLYFTANSIIGNTEVNHLYRRLKFAVEGITLTQEEVAIKYASLIERIKTFCEQYPEVNTSSKLWTSNLAGRVLYKEVSSDPHAPYIWRLAGLIEGRENFDYWSDRELVLAAAPAGTFTCLKNSNDRLHRQIKGRRLEAALACEEPSFANHFYIGHQGELYRSQPELVAGNYFVLRGINHFHEVSTGVKREDSKRSMVADFQILPANRFLEIAQNLERNRGHRRVSYCDRMVDKEKRHTEAGLPPIIFDSDPYFVRGVLDVAGMATGLRRELMKHGIDIGDPPAESDLIYSDDEVKRSILQDPIENLWNHFEELGIKDVSTLQNHFSHILTCLRLRVDYKLIIATMKSKSSLLRSEKTRERHALKRELYATLDEVRVFFNDHEISNQPKWTAFAKENRKLLKERNIPANPYSLYKRSGSWISWPYLYACLKSTK